MKKSLLIYVIFIVFCISTARGTEDNLQDDYSGYNEKIYKKYIKMDLMIKDIAEKSVKQLLPYLLKSREQINISSSCTRNLFDLITGFRKLTNWSFNFLDSMGKIQSGIQNGNLQMFGEYEECVDTSIMKKGKVDFQGQYCSLSTRPYLPKLKRIPGLKGRIEGLVNATRNSSDFTKLIVSKVHLFYAARIKTGLCVPSGCTKQDIAEIANYSLGDYVNTTVEYCLKKGDIYFWTTKRTIIVYVFALFGAIVLVSTCLDNLLESWKNKQIGFKSRILQCFSLTRNFPKLMNTDVSEKSITCLHGIRVLTIFWVVLAHEYFIQGLVMTSNHMLNYEKMLDQFFSQILFNAFNSVDMFFFMSGFVNIYTRMLIKTEGRSQPGFLKVMAHRLWRIYPAYITAFLLLYLLSKPQPYFYDLQEEFTKYCDIYWWRNFLFISNFFNPFKMCMLHTWYLCVDMQLFLLSLITVPVLLRNSKKGIMLHVGIILIVNLFSMIRWFVSYVAPSTHDGTRLDWSESAKSFQITGFPAVHVGPYVIGILLGYLIATEKEIKIPKITQLFGWIAAFILFNSMLFLILRWNSGIPYTHLESALYGAWSRTLMVLGFSWLVFCCATGRGGLFNYILSLKLWIPLSRMTYMIYLVSPIIQSHYASHVSFPEDFTDIRMIWNTFGSLCVSVLMSLSLVLIVESPVIAMEKILFGKKEDKSKTTSEVPKELTFNNGNENELRENGKFTTIHI